MSYQNPTKFENEITHIEFDRKNAQGGNDYITCAEWTDKYGEQHNKYVVCGDEFLTTSAFRLHCRLLAIWWLQNNLQGG